MAIQYLLKFVARKEYAEMLLDGYFFMRPAEYYHRGEVSKLGQNDIMEAAVSHQLRIYKHGRCPIFCMSMIQDTDIEQGKVTISEQCIEDFHCEDGYLVIINFEEFEKKLHTLYSEGYCVCGGPVNYRNITLEEMCKLMGDNSPKNLFIKHPLLAYQREFRIVVCKELYKINEPAIDEKVYCIPSNLRSIASYVKISSLIQNGRHILQL